MRHRRIALRMVSVITFAAANWSGSAFAAGKVVVSQVYGGGGNSGATLKNDFIELFNSGDTAVSLSGWSVQYQSAAGTGAWQVSPLAGSIAPGGYYLVQEAQGSGGSASLPAPDATGTIAMSATSAKVAVASSTTAFTGSCPSGANLVDFVAYGNPSGSGTVSCSEGSGSGATPAPILSNTTADFRGGAGCTDSGNNTADFVSPGAAPAPRNSASPVNACLSITSVSQAEGNTGQTVFPFVAQLNIPAPATVSFTAATADVTAKAGSDYTALGATSYTIPAGQSSTTIAVAVNGDVLVEPDETFTISLSNIAGAGPTLPMLQATGAILNDDTATVSLSFSPATLPNTTEGTSYAQVITVVNGGACSFDTTGGLPPGLTLNFGGSDNVATLAGTPSLTGSYAFTVSAGCSNGSTLQNYSVSVAFACESGIKTSTPIHTIQGSGPVSFLTGQTREVEGIVVGVLNGTGQFGGYYLQEPDATWDSDPATSEGIFIHDNGSLAAAIGDRVRVRGVVTEYVSTAPSSLTELDGVAGQLTCSVGNTFTRTVVTLPVAAAGDLERYEGMAVQFSQQLVVTGNYNLGAFGQVDLAPKVLFQPTQSASQSSWPPQADLNARSLVGLDDGKSLANANLYPTLYPQGGLSAANTLRAGALVNYDAQSHKNAPLEGVMDDRYGSRRLQPTAAVTFYNANPRPEIAPILASVGGRFRAVSANVLNFFTTLGSRGAQTQTEFDHQKIKVIEALYAMNADVYGLSEVQNFANGSTNGGTYTNTALQSLVDGLNCKASGQSPLCTNPPLTVFAFIDTLGLGASNGTDAIRSAIVYKPSVLMPAGSPAEYYQNDTNRPTLAQTFRPASGVKADQQTFTFVVNHLRSKGSACGGTSDDVYQGTCNGLRLNMATNVANWLAGNPTGDPAGANRRLLLVGDFNAYYGEDPIQYLVANGYTNLIHVILGDGAYSYNFGSQAGYLDHALANVPFNVLVRRVAEWHNNADEPSALQALNSGNKSADAQAAYYAADPWAASDHDPIVIGFNTLAGDLNDDGVVDYKDRLLLLMAFGKNASAVDRRMDYDGDGTVTVKDLLIWTDYWRAYRD